ncbi:MAG: hypothetical protein QM674_22265 [Burkholderiaceae bacterium]
MTQADANPPPRLDLSRFEQPAVRRQIEAHLALEEQVRIAQQDAELARAMALRFERELDEERKRVARDVEGMAEQIAALRALGQTLEHRLGATEPSLAQLATMIKTGSDGVLAHIRHVLRSVRPETLVGEGLISALRALIEDWRLRRPAQRFELLTKPESAERFGLGEPDVEALAMRIAELALQDAAQPDLWWSTPSLLLVSARTEDGQLTLQISHDARSRQPDDALLAKPAWADLLERLRPLGGRLSVGEGEGFEVLAVLPWPLDL